MSGRRGYRGRGRGRRGGRGGAGRGDVNRQLRSAEHGRRTAWAKYYEARDELMDLHLAFRRMQTEGKQQVPDGIRDKLQGLTGYIARQSLVCPICTDDEDPISGDNLFATKCGHLFHSQCVEPWIRDHRNCPKCRAQLESK